MATPLGINVVDCSAAGVLGTGLAGCRIDRKRVVALGLLEKGTYLDQDIDKDYIQSLQVAGKLIYLKGVVSFVDSTPDDNIGTREGSGIKSLIGQFPYEYTATFDNGFNYQKALDSLSGNSNYDLVLFDVDDVMWFTKNRAGDVKGFALGMHQAGKYLGNDGTNLSSETLFLQLTDRKEVDARMAMFKPTDFGASDLDGVNDVTIKIDPIVAPSTSLVFSPLLNDGSHFAAGMLVGDYVIKNNGAVVTPSGITSDPVTKKVTATIAATVAGHTYTVEVDGIVLTAADVLYKSPAVATVIAT